MNILTVMLARVLGPLVRVNAVAPGPIEGAWLEHALGPAFEPVMKACREKSLLGKVCTPADVRDAILGLVQGSDMVTGQVLISWTAAWESGNDRRHRAIYGHLAPRIPVF